MSNGKFLLKEFHGLCPDGLCNLVLLTEDEKRMKQNGDVFLTGILQVADVKNGNGRIYPQRILSREIDNYQKAIRENRALGVLDHDDSEQVLVKNASHLILRTWWDGNKVMGVVKVLNTPNGQIVKSLIESGVQLGISSRALGSLTESREGMIVEDDLVLICFDIVAEPSAPGAYLSLSESKKKINESLTKQDRIYRLLNDILREE